MKFLLLSAGALLPLFFQVLLCDPQTQQKFQFNEYDERSPRVPREENDVRPIEASSSKNAPLFQPMSNDLPSMTSKDKVD
jgi:hypothetical protein